MTLLAVNSASVRSISTSVSPPSVDAPSKPSAETQSGPTDWGPASRLTRTTNHETYEEGIARARAFFEASYSPEFRAKILARDQLGGGGRSPSVQELKDALEGTRKRLELNRRSAAPEALKLYKARFGEVRGTNLFAQMTKRLKESEAEFNSLSAVLAQCLADQQGHATPAPDAAPASTSQSSW